VKRVIHRWLPLLAVGGLLVAIWLAAALSSPQLNSVPIPPLRVATSHSRSIPPHSASASPSVPEDDEVTQVENPDERTGLIAAVGLLVLLAVGGATGWLVYRRRLAGSRKDPVVLSRRVVLPAKKARKADVVSVVDAGIAELSDTDSDPRRAVIACWMGLERAAAATGVPRHPGDSPTDLVSRLLQTQRVRSEALSGLAEVYRQARYATHAIDEDMRTTAVEALRQVRAELTTVGVS
jgi:hypothetical protein